MPVFALGAALAASLVWALCALLSHGPAKALGSFEFTRIQLIVASLVLLVIVTLTGGWASIDPVYLPAFAVSAVIGVLGSNLATVACLRRGGPRREHLLRSLSPVFAAVMAFFFLGETLSLKSLMGGALVMAGLVLAILYGHRRDGANRFEQMQGSLRSVLFFGLLAALCHAIGITVLKPAMAAGTDPFAGALLRSGGAALAILALSLLPSGRFRSLTPVTPKLVWGAALPGLLGYIGAVSLLLYALAQYDTALVVILGSTAPIMLLPLIWATTGERPPLPAWIGAGLAVAGAAVITV